MPGRRQRRADVEASKRYDGNAALEVKTRHQRTAGVAERLCEVFGIRYLEALKMRLTAREAHVF